MLIMQLRKFEFLDKRREEKVENITFNIKLALKNEELQILSS